MKTQYSILASVIGITFSCAVFAQGCEYDTQCKGDRVCEAGKCISPSATKETPKTACSRGAFPDGICLPAATDPNIPDEVRARLYFRCAQSGGKDEYTAQCCDHLTGALQDKYGVCRAAPSPTFLKDIQSLPWQDIVKMIATKK